MRRIGAIMAAMIFLLSTAAGWAEEGKISKVLSLYLDKKGRESVYPSLYERDAYQFYLRKHLQQRQTLRIAVQWKAKGVDWEKTKLKAELRGLLNNTVSTVTLEQPAKKHGLFSNWSNLEITGADYKKFGELMAWRVSIWDGDKELGSLESFLWSGVPPSQP